MKSLTPAVSTALRRTVTAPISLIELGFDPVVRLSTRGDVQWRGHPWSGVQRVAVSGLAADGSGAQTAQIEIGNYDLAFGTVVLSHGVADRAVRIWQGDAAAMGDDDLALAFEGVIESAEVGDAVRISCGPTNSAARNFPLRRIGEATGFTHVLPAGTVLRFGANTFKLERG